MILKFTRRSLVWIQSVRLFLFFFSFGPNFSYSYYIKDVCDRAFREYIIVFYNDTVSIGPV